MKPAEGSEDQSNTEDAKTTEGSEEDDDEYEIADNVDLDTALLLSCQDGDEYTVKKLLQAGADPNNIASTFEYWRPIHCVVASGDSRCLDVLLRYGKDMDINKETPGGTALYLSCKHEYISMVLLLLQAGADPNIASYKYPLYAAAKRGNVAITEMLLDYGADVNCVNRCYGSVLYMTVSLIYNRLDIIRILLEHNASLDVAGQDDEPKPIFILAALYRKYECLELLLKAAKDRKQEYLVNQQIVEDDPEPIDDLPIGATPLFAASRHGNFDAVRLLLEYGADANIMTKEKVVPLHTALFNGHLTVIEELLPHTDIQLSKDYTCSLFFYLLYSKKDPEFKMKALELLLKHGADVNCGHQLDLQNIIRRCRLKQLDFIPEECKSFTNGIASLALSVLFEPKDTRSSIISLLIKNGAHVNVQTLEDFPPLIPALGEGKIQHARLLLEAGTNIDMYHPKLQGNITILLCLENWQTLCHLLRLGAEVETLFSKDKYIACVEKALKKLDSGTEWHKEEMANQQTYMTFEQYVERISNVPNRFNNICKVLHKIIYYCGAVSISEQLLNVIESDKKIKEDIVKLTETVRPLKHLCRLMIRQQLGSQRLFNQQNTRKQYFLPECIWDYIFFSEVED